MLALTCFFGLKNLVINLNVLVNNYVCEYVHVVFRSLAKDSFSVRHFFFGEVCAKTRYADMSYRESFAMPFREEWPSLDEPI